MHSGRHLDGSASHHGSHNHQLSLHGGRLSQGGTNDNVSRIYSAD